MLRAIGERIEQATYTIRADTLRSILDDLKHSAWIARDSLPYFRALVDQEQAERQRSVAEFERELAQSFEAEGRELKERFDHLREHDPSEFDSVVADLTSMVAEWRTVSTDADASPPAPEFDPAKEAQKRADLLVTAVHWRVDSAIDRWYGCALHLAGDEGDTLMAAAIEACQIQMAMAEDVRVSRGRQYPDAPLFQHRGYRQLAIVLERAGDAQYAMALCAQAQAQGWPGDWEKRLARLQKKLGRS